MPLCAGVGKSTVAVNPGVHAGADGRARGHLRCGRVRPQPAHHGEPGAARAQDGPGPRAASSRPSTRASSWCRSGLPGRAAPSCAGPWCPVRCDVCLCDTARTARHAKHVLCLCSQHRMSLDSALCQQHFLFQATYACILMYRLHNKLSGSRCCRSALLIALASCSVLRQV